MHVGQRYSIIWFWGWNIHKHLCLGSFRKGFVQINRQPGRCRYVWDSNDGRMRKLGNTLKDSGPIPRYAGRQEVLFSRLCESISGRFTAGKPSFLQNGTKTQLILRSQNHDVTFLIHSRKQNPPCAVASCKVTKHTPGMPWSSRRILGPESNDWVLVWAYHRVNNN